jgi:2-keto-4-pentenoate hydratase/2-oxohepta-3-ene-1,7-dioic acid hydratase in catechol pathway
MDVKLNGKSIRAQRVFCIGMNYAEHVHELKGKTPDQPVVFMKPAQSIAPVGKELDFPVHGNDLHYETELVILIGQSGHVKNETDSLSFISGVTLGFDLTMRDLQGNLKKTGHPWEISKAFEDSAPLGDFVEYDSSIDIHSIEFTGCVNNEVRQRGNSAQMIFPVEKLVHHIGSVWKFIPGDIIFTGTPPGVGSLKKSDIISARCATLSLDFSWKFH